MNTTIADQSYFLFVSAVSIVKSACFILHRIVLEIPAIVKVYTRVHSREAHVQIPFFISFIWQFTEPKAQAEGSNAETKHHSEGNDAQSSEAVDETEETNSQENLMDVDISDLQSIFDTPRKYSLKKH